MICAMIPGAREERGKGKSVRAEAEEHSNSPNDASRDHSGEQGAVDECLFAREKLMHHARDRAVCGKFKSHTNRRGEERRKSARQKRTEKRRDKADHRAPHGTANKSADEHGQMHRAEHRADLGNLTRQKWHKIRKCQKKRGEHHFQYLFMIFHIYLIFLPSENARPTFSPKFQYACVTLS